MCDYIITNEEIEKAEQNIFENGLHFNDEQKEFIKCLDSFCVQAYAGTGKTTSMVGKLHILAQKNVWQNGRGICVLSHTNVAVDEIKKHVANHYPSVMQYPNFIGTIQEFVNKFLFIPCLASQGLKIKFQDEKCVYKHNYVLLNQCSDQIKNAIIQAENIYKDKELFSKIYLDNNEPYFDGKPFPLHSVNKKRKKANKIPQTCLKEINEYFSKLIEERRQNGIFIFDETFIDGGEYVKQNKILKEIIANRFQFVFLDEAQDCSKVQLDLLNELFADKPQTVFQQIGDTNQTISETAWSPNNDFLTLSQSIRFGNNIAQFINKFRIDVGIGVSGTISETKKYLIIYDSGKEKHILQKFAEILKSENISTPEAIFAISHRHEHLEKYFLEYSEKLAKNKSKKTSYRFDNDIEYVNLLTEEALYKRGSNFVSKILFSLLYKHFKVEGKSWLELKEYLRESEKIDNFKELVLNMSLDILKNGRITDLNTLKFKLNKILGESKINFDDHSIPTQASTVTVPNDIQENKFSYDGIDINIGTIHSVKGQTHDATLLFSNEEETKQDLKHCIDNTKIRGPKFKKRIYVAASRPKDLFAIAIEQGAYDSLLDNSWFEDFEKEIV